MSEAIPRVTTPFTTMVTVCHAWIHIALCHNVLWTCKGATKKIWYWEEYKKKKNYFWLLLEMMVLIRPLWLISFWADEGSVITFILLTSENHSFKYLPLALLYCLSLTLIDEDLVFSLSLSASLSTYLMCSRVELKMASTNWWSHYQSPTQVRKYGVADFSTGS